jgi:hypothetical protein
MNAADASLRFCRLSSCISVVPLSSHRFSRMTLASSAARRYRSFHYVPFVCVAMALHGRHSAIATRSTLSDTPRPALIEAGHMIETPMSASHISLLEQRHTLT